MVQEKVVCIDALIHWQHPDLGLIRTSELFYHADKQRKLNSVTEWMIRNACQKFLSWRAMGFSPELIGVSLSIKQLENTQFIYNISRILSELQFNPTWLMLEIKENFSSISFDVLEKALNMLTYLGIKIAIDNFGAGSSSLNYLKNLNINYLKLDQAMIDDVMRNDRAKKILKSIIMLAHDIDMEVIVQGIETKEQANILKELGYSLMQGQLFGKLLLEQEVVREMEKSS